jgi:Flp pilus assembly CpaF family ATPase
MTEVMVNGPDDVYVERKGRIEKVLPRLPSFEYVRS